MLMTCLMAIGHICLFLCGADLIRILSFPIRGLAIDNSDGYILSFLIEEFNIFREGFISFFAEPLPLAIMYSIILCAIIFVIIMIIAAYFIKAPKKIMVISVMFGMLFSLLCIIIEPYMQSISNVIMWIGIILVGAASIFHRFLMS